MTQIDASTAVTSSDPTLAEHAAVIHQLRQRAREDIVEIGRHLVEARDHVGHGAWLDWISVEFGWSDQTARNFIHVYEFSRDPKSKPVLDLDLPLRVLYQIAAPKAEAAREEIKEHIEAGEPISRETVIQAVAGRPKSAPVDVETETDDPSATAEARKAQYAANENAADGADDVGVDARHADDVGAGARHVDDDNLRGHVVPAASVRTRNFEACDHAQSKKMQKFLLRSALQPN